MNQERPLPRAEARQGRSVQVALHLISTLVQRTAPPGQSASTSAPPPVRSDRNSRPPSRRHSLEGPTFNTADLLAHYSPTSRRKETRGGWRRRRRRRRRPGSPVEPSEGAPGSRPAGSHQVSSYIGISHAAPCRRATVATGCFQRPGRARLLRCVIVRRDRRGGTGTGDGLPTCRTREFLRVEGSPSAAVS